MQRNRPVARHTTAQLRHTQSELVTSRAQHRSGRPRYAAQITRKLTASWPQPCRLPKCKSAFRACAPPLGQYGRRAAFHDRHRQQSSPAFLAAYVELSWSALQQSQGEFGPRFDQAVKFPEHHATGRYGCELRAQRRNSTGNEIGINEVNEPGNPRQIIAGKRCLSSSIRSSEDNAAWFPASSSHASSLSIQR